MLKSLFRPLMTGVARHGVGAGTGVHLPVLLSRSVGLGDSNMAAISAGWYSQMVVRSRGKFKSLNNAGVAGERSDQIYARMDADVIAFDPDVCFVMVGTNDIEQGVLDATLRANVELIQAKLAANNVVGVFCALLPNNNNPARTLTHNAWLQSWCRSNRLHFLDTHTPISDGAGSYAVGFNGDALHTNSLGATTVADASVVSLYNAWSEWPLATSDSADSTSMLTNAITMADANADGFPDGWAVIGAGVVSEVITDATRGKGIKLTITAGSSSGAGFFFTTATGRFAAGEQVLGLFDVRVSSGLTTRFSMRESPSLAQNVKFSPWVGECDGIVHGKVTLAADTTGISFRIYADGTGTIEIFKPTLRNLTRSPYAAY